jgi:two-component system, OmpR family, response regulator
VSEAGNVAEAILAVRAQRPDWIVLDLMLPDGSGVNVIRRIREEGLPTRVCIVSGCCSDVQNDALSEGADHVFTKPLDLERLMSVLSGP